MKEKPILFSGEMVRAILAGTKTQTRRVVKPKPKHMLIEGVAHHTFGMNPAEDGLNWYDADCVNPGRLVRCPFGHTGTKLWVRETWAEYHGTIFRATYPEGAGPAPFKWKPSIFMPRWASRITLEIVAVRVERLQDITEGDARAEGVASVNEFMDIWFAINKSWNPLLYVWVIQFRKLQ